MRETSLPLVVVGRAFALAVSVVASTTGCGDDDTEVEPAAPDLIADVRILQDIVTADPATRPIEDAEALVDEERSSVAAELLEQGALPTAARQVELVEAAEMSTSEGRGLKRRLRRAYERRLEALETYRTVLARGYIEDLAFVEAMGGLREALDEITAVDEDLNAIRPLPDDRSARSPAPAPRGMR